MFHNPVPTLFETPRVSVLVLLQQEFLLDLQTESPQPASHVKCEMPHNNYIIKIKIIIALTITQHSNYLEILLVIFVGKSL